MKPIELWQGDCLELMKNIPDGSVDLVLTDPPYGTMKGAALDGWKNQTTELDRSGLKVKQINELLGTSTMASHYFRAGCQFVLPTKEKYEKLQTTGFWQRPYKELKEKTIPVFNLWQGGKSKSNVLEYKKDNDGYHPTQKPVALLEDLIQTYSNEGNTVLDFTMGSGSTGVACVNTNRHFIGIELDEGYFNIAKKRIEEACL
ncbi:MAG: hypothetical protein IJ366_00515 [Clostridia bacterium]|nr:hypothetical protein [Clostridia bacterium]MBQ7792981.1 hypothetical protein [Clostridia bacterium]